MITQLHLQYTAFYSRFQVIYPEQDVQKKTDRKDDSEEEPILKEWRPYGTLTLEVRSDMQTHPS